MKTDETKTATTSIKELSTCYTDLTQVLKETTDCARTTKQLWRNKNKPTLIKIGLALIAFPDPTISDIIGAALVVAGTVQAGIRRQTMYVDDISKTFQSTLRDIQDLKHRV
jgi:hypothetical protein